MDLSTFSREDLSRFSWSSWGSCTQLLPELAAAALPSAPSPHPSPLRAGRGQLPIHVALARAASTLPAAEHPPWEGAELEQHLQSSTNTPACRMSHQGQGSLVHASTSFPPRWGKTPLTSSCSGSPPSCLPGCVCRNPPESEATPRTSWTVCKQSHAPLKS